MSNALCQSNFVAQVTKIWYIIHVDIFVDINDVHFIHDGVHVDVDHVFADVHGDVHVVHVYAHHDGYDGWVDAENFKTLPQLVTEIWYIIHVDVHVNDNDVLVAVHVDVHHDGYDGWVDHEYSGSYHNG